MDPALERAVQQGRDGVYLNIHAQPGARRPSLRGMHGDAVKIAVAEAAQDGKANAAIIAFLAAALAMPKRDIAIVSGHASRRKRVFLRGDCRMLLDRLGAWLAER